MKRLTLLLATAAIAAPLSLAQAADIGDPAYDWSGAYIGVQAGYLWGDASVVNFNAGGAVNATSTPDPDGFLAGLHAGYNHQIDAFVLGVEADINFSGASSGFERALNAGGVPFATAIDHKADVDLTASLRARLGYAAGEFMPYLTAGLAVADYDVRRSHTVNQGKHQETMLGWTVGAGMEWAATESLTTRIEYRYSDYGKEGGSSNFANFPLETNDISLDTHQVTVGLSYKF